MEAIKKSLNFSKVKPKKQPTLFEKKYGYLCLTYLPSKNLILKKIWLQQTLPKYDLTVFFIEGLPKAESYYSLL